MGHFAGKPKYIQRVAQSPHQQKTVWLTSPPKKEKRHTHTPTPAPTPTPTPKPTPHTHTQNIRTRTHTHTGRCGQSRWPRDRTKVAAFDAGATPLGRQRAVATGHGRGNGVFWLFFTVGTALILLGGCSCFVGWTQSLCFFDHTKGRHNLYGRFGLSVGCQETKFLLPHQGWL